MRYCVEVFDCGETNIWKQEAMPTLSDTALSFNTANELLDELVNYGRTVEEANRSIDHLKTMKEYERFKT